MAGGWPLGSSLVTDLRRVCNTLVLYAWVWIPDVPAMSLIAIASTASDRPYVNLSASYLRWSERDLTAER